MDFKIKIDDDDQNKKMAHYSSSEEKAKVDEAPSYNPVEKQEQPAQEKNKTAGTSTSFCSVLTYEYYFPLFDVDAPQVGQRILHSFIPIKANFFPMIENNPDIYGPFWICTTLIFLIAASGNLSCYLRDTDNFKYNFNLIPMAACLIYSYGFLIPLVIFSLGKWFDMKFSYTQVLCIYGYSLSCFLPVVLICIIPIDVLQWLLLAYAVTNSSLFLMVNIWKEISALENKNKYILLGVVLTLQVGLLIMFKLFFFSAELFCKNNN